MQYQQWPEGAPGPWSWSQVVVSGHLCKSSRRYHSVSHLSPQQDPRLGFLHYCLRCVLGLCSHHCWVPASVWSLCWLG